MNRKKIKFIISTTVVAVTLATAVGFVTYSNEIQVNNENNNTEGISLAINKIDKDTINVSLENIEEIVIGLEVSFKVEGEVTPRLDNINSQEYVHAIYDNTTKMVNIYITSIDGIEKVGNNISLGDIELVKNEGALTQNITFSTASYKLITDTSRDYVGIANINNETIDLNDAPTIIDANPDVVQTIIKGQNFDPMSLIGEKIIVDDDGGSDSLVVTTDIASVDLTTIGIKYLTYTVTDDNGAKTSLKIQLLVIDEVLQNPPTFEGLVSERNIKVGEDFNPKNGVIAKDEEGNVIEFRITGEIDLLNVGRYTLTYIAIDKSGNTTSEDIVINVVANNVPQFAGIENITIQQGEAFNPREGVTVTDVEDGEISIDNVTISGSVNVNIPGTYQVNYTVKDSDNNIVSVNRIVTVNGNVEVVNNLPIINAEDKTINVGEKFEPLVGVTATDEEDGDLTDKVEVVNNTVDTSMVGKYEVSYRVTDSNGASVDKTIFITVELKETGLSKNMEDIILNNELFTAIKGESTNENPLTLISNNVAGDRLQNYLNGISNIVISIEKGAIENNIQYYNLTILESQSRLLFLRTEKIYYVSIGIRVEHNELLKVMDDYILSLDNSIPTISANDITITVGDNFEPLLGVTATDKEDGDLTDKVEVLKSTVDTSKIGVYEVTYRVTDSKGAVVDKTITVVVNPKMEVSNNLPIITVSDKRITVGEKFEPLSGVTATDEEDGNLTDKVEVLKNTVDTGKVGVYEVTYKVTDSNGFTTTKTIKVEVVANVDLKVDKKENETIPKTGGTNAVVLATIGMLIAAIGAVLTIKKKKQY